MSTSNDNGRYFEYLVTKNFVNKYGVQLTKRAKNDQLRDSKKKLIRSKK